MTVQKPTHNLFLRYYLFGDKIIQNCLKIDATHPYDNDLLLRQETQNKISCPGSWYNNNKKQQHWFDVSRSNDAFLQDVFQMAAIALVSVINTLSYQSYLFWDTLYIWWESFSSADLRSVEYPFIVITQRFFLARSGSSCFVWAK